LSEPACKPRASYNSNAGIGSHVGVASVDDSSLRKTQLGGSICLVDELPAQSSIGGQSIASTAPQERRVLEGIQEQLAGLVSSLNDSLCNIQHKEQQQKQQQQQQQMSISREQVTHATHEISSGANALCGGTTGNYVKSATPPGAVGIQQQPGTTRSQSLSLAVTGGPSTIVTLSGSNRSTPVSQSRGCLESKATSRGLVNSVPATPLSTYRPILSAANPDSLISRHGLQSETDDALTGVPSVSRLNSIRAGFRQQGGVRSCTPNATPVGIPLAAASSGNASRGAAKSPGPIQLRSASRCTSR